MRQNDPRSEWAVMNGTDTPLKNELSVALVNTYNSVRQTAASAIGLYVYILRISCLLEFYYCNLIYFIFY